MEAEVNRVLRFSKSVSATRVQQKGTVEEVRAVRGAAMVL